MIPDRTGVTVDSTVTGEGIAMSIDRAAFAHLMNVMTDLYADAERAILREYSTNAADAHAEACCSLPIEITLPTDLRPLFTVRDYGPGLDRDDIAEVYSQYGASTKRGSNDAVGMLGLGCKSALSYVDQFTVTGIKDGIRTVVSVARDETGAGTMTVLEREPTEDACGVLVAIPTKRDNDLAEKAEDFFQYWEAGTVLIDGQEPEPIDGYELTPELLIVDRGTRGWPRGPDAPRMQVVMGNVAYPVADPSDFGCDLGLPASKALVARVPIGSVKFPPNRESLMDAPVTRKALAKVLHDFNAAGSAAIQRDVDAADTKAGAMLAVVEGNEALGLNNPNVTYQGEVVPTSIVAADDATVWRVRPGGYGGRAEGHRASVSAVEADLAAAAIWVTAYDNSDWSAAQRRKLNVYAQHELLPDGQKGHAQVVFLVEGALPGDGWLDDAMTVEWDVVRKWRNPDDPIIKGGMGKYAGTYPGYQPGGDYIHDQISASDLPKDGKGVYYFVGQKYGAYAQHNKLGNDCYLIVLPATRKEKFLRLFPKARPVAVAFEDRAKKWWRALTAQQREAVEAFGGGNSSRDALASLTPGQIDDPELARWAKLAKVYDADLDEGASVHVYQLGDTVNRHGEAAKAYNRYPLMPRYGLDAGNGKVAYHTYLYINAAYAAQRKDSSQ